MLNPLPVQNFADEITIVEHDKSFRTYHEESRLGCESIKMYCFIQTKIGEQLVYRQND